MGELSCYDCEHLHVCILWHHFDFCTGLFDWDNPDVGELRQTFSEKAAKFCNHFKQKEDE